MATTDITFGQQTITMPTDLQSVGARWDSTGQALVAPDNGLSSDYFTFPGKVPNGLSWLSDTLHGYDIYKAGFVQTPTLFFDPTATSSLNRGTYANPYNTQTALQTAITGDMRGHVLGFKRGTTLNVTGTNGLALTCYGTSSDPFIICPYGDSEALPIITGETVVTGWTLVDATYNIWSYAQATETDVWQSGSRLWKAVWSTSAVNTLSTAGTGRATYNSGTLYIRPFSGENPTLGQMVIAPLDYAMLVKYSDVATSGYIQLAGLDIRYARKTACEISASATTTISALAGIKVAGCKIGRAGVDVSGGTASDALLVYGASNAVRMTTLEVVGNELYDACNNACEIAGMDGGTNKDVRIEHNYGHTVGGNSICELWSSNSNVLLRYNYGDGGVTENRAYKSFAGSGFWFANYYESAGNWNTDDGAGALGDSTHSKNVGNIAVFNLIKDPYTRGMRISGGATHKVQHNTVFIDADVTHPVSTTVAAQGWFTEGTAATGFCDISNNLFFWKTGTSAHRYPNLARMGTLGASASIPSGNNNIYFSDWGAGDSTFYYNGAGTGNFTTYKTAISAYSMDQASLCSTDNTGGTVTAATLNFSEETMAPGAGSVALSAGLTTLTGIGKRYRQGNPYASATPTIGCSLGG